MSNPIKKLLGTMTCFISFIVPAQADSLFEADRWQFRGFGTLAATYNDDKNADFVRNIAQSDQENRPWSFSQDSILGGQANYRHPSGRLSGTLQAVSKYRYNGSYSPEISLAFLNYHFSNNLQLRAGRLSPGILHRSDSRDVGYSYLWTRPPVEFYGAINASRFDGLDLKWTHFSDQAAYKLQGFWGLSHERVSGKDGDIFDYKDSTFTGAIAEYEKDSLSLRASVIELRLKSQISSVDQLYNSLNNLAQLYNAPHLSDLADEFSVDGKKLQYYSIGATWEPDRWVLQAGSALIESNSLTVPDLTTSFFSAGYRIDKWTPYIVYSRAKSEDHTRTTGLGADLDALIIEPVLKSGQVDQTSISLGSRYELSQSMAVKVQYDRVQSEVKEGLFIYPTGSAEWDGDFDIFTIGLDFIF